MRQRYFCLLLLAAALAGCKKPAEPAADAPAPSTPAKSVAVDGAPDAPPPPPAPAAPDAPADAPPPSTEEIPNDVVVNLNYLNQIVRDYFNAEMRMPKDLNELVKGGYAQSLPTPPPGKKWVIDAQARKVTVR